MSGDPLSKRRWNIFCKMILISVVGLGGLLALGGIGYRISAQLTMTATDSLRRMGEAREAYAQTTEAALRSEEEARLLSRFNEDLIALQQLVVEGTNGHKPGVTEESIIQAARELAERAEMVNTMPGAEQVVPGTKGLTLAGRWRTTSMTSELCLNMSCRESSSPSVGVRNSSVSREQRWWP